MSTETKVVTLDQMRRPEQSMGLVQVGMTNSAGFELLQRAAKAMASSTLVPKEFQGNVANCIIAVEMSSRIGASPLMVAQNLYIVHGRPGWSSKFLIASFNQCGRFSAIRYEWTGKQGSDDWGCKAWSIEKETGERIEGPLITIALAKKEGWYSKSGSKWQSIPQLMLMYRAAGWLVNTHAPEISMGLSTAEDIGDTFDATATDAGSYQVTLEGLREARSEPMEFAAEGLELFECRINGSADPEALRLELDALRDTTDDGHKAERVAIVQRRLEALTEA